MGSHDDQINMLRVGQVENVLQRMSAHHGNIPWLLLDSRVVDLAMSYNPVFVILSSLKPLFFRDLKNELRLSDNMEA